MEKRRFTKKRRKKRDFCYFCRSSKSRKIKTDLGSKNGFLEKKRDFCILQKSRFGFLNYVSMISILKV